MKNTSIKKLAEFGQSIWLDNINRVMIGNGKLKENIQLGLRGLTSNPTIFDKAISKSSDYDRQIAKLSRQNKTVFDIYDDLTIKDIQDAADIFLPVYEETKNLDGYVSLEINPKLAFDKQKTIEEGKRLHRKVNRPNLMLKVPSTEEGFEAVEALTASGINVNVTLIFSLQQYVKSAWAYLKGLKGFLKEKGDTCLRGTRRQISKVYSVASVFVSRVDTAVDDLLEQKLSADNKLVSLKGKAAVANASLIYKKYLEIFSGNEFKELEKNAAHPQRVLWGSTGTKNPAYSDIKYVAELIGRNTINTVPEGTFEAFLEHGIVKEALTGDSKKAQGIIDNLKETGIDVDGICEGLQKKGVVLFENSFESLLASIDEKVKSLIC